jgi:hypothetical protein
LGAVAGEREVFKGRVNEVDS